MASLELSKNSHPAFSYMQKGDRVNMFLEVTVREDAGKTLNFEVSKMELTKDKVRRHPSQIMRDFHVEPTV